MTDGEDRELAASEQMRDRIADYLLLQIGARDGGGNTAMKVQRALIPIERTIRHMPGRPAR
ncbi:hypothetical protein [Novosphingobium resinovorum]|uniref:hypothetical protein n=1 Tax=Novosphingobium resinovorum TaxID=158500 RepID=UPI002ED16850|nr:hypothetical protein [Novosphingobium resinovorum]